MNNFSFDFLQNPFYYRDTPEKQYWNKFETDGETDLAIAYMKERAGSGKPFFLTISPHPPHAPWRVEQTRPEDLARIPKDLHWRPNS